MKHLTSTLAALCAATTMMAQPIAPADAIRTCATPSPAEYAQIENPSEVFSTLRDQWSNRVGEYHIQRTAELKKQVNQPVQKAAAAQQPQADNSMAEQVQAYAQKLSEMALPLLSEADLEKFETLDSKGLMKMLNQKIKDAGQTPPDPADYGITEDMLVDANQDSRAAEERFGDEYQEMENKMPEYEEQYQRQLAGFRQQALSKMKAVSKATIADLDKKLATEIIGKGADNAPYTTAQYNAFRQQRTEAVKKYKQDLYAAWTENAIRPAQKAMLEYNDILVKWEGMKAKMYQLNLDTYTQAWGEFGYSTINESSSKAWALYADILFHVVDIDEFMQ